MTRAAHTLLTALLLVSVAAATASASDPCRWQARMPADGHVDKLTHVAGKDTLGLTPKSGKVALQVGNTGTSGSGLSVHARAAYGAVDFNGSPVCVALTNLVFKLGGKLPMVGEPQPLAPPPAGKPISHLPSPATPAVIYIDLNEKKSVAGMGTPTIDYIATSGSYRFTALNTASADPDKKGESVHTIAFDVTVTRVADQATGKLDTTTKTRLEGKVTFSTLRPLH